MNIVFTSRFQRLYKKYYAKLNPRQRLEVENRIDRFIGNSFLPEFRTHKLDGREARWAFTILRDSDRNDRIVFALTKNTITLLMIGSHDEVY